MFSRTLKPSTDPDVEIVSGDPVEFVRRLKQQDGPHLWPAGGGELAGQLLPEIDEIVVKLNPIVAGSGVPLVARGFDPARYALASSRPLTGGVLVLHYARGQIAGVGRGHPEDET